LRVIPLFAAAALIIPLGSGLAAQTHSVALTIDDLPFVAADDTRPMLPTDAKAAEAANHKLLLALARRHVPVTGFVIQKGVEDLGIASGTEILRRWTQRGLDLGNHTYSHPDSNDLTIEQFEEQITRGESTFIPLMKAAGRKPEFFRFPFNHTGDTKEKHDALAAFLAQRGYRLAPCTIENSDWVFSAAYERMLARQDHATAARLRAEYLAFTSAQIDYFIGLNTHVLGYEQPEIMLIHDNQLNADVIGKLLALFEKKHYRWVSLSEAESDPVYRSPDSLVTMYGPMWGYRWARERGVKVDGSLEPEPPQWITDYGRDEPSPPRRQRLEF
jgi:peptidoglycan/xylan/chitin deacetylase (PgdA/CDA1 family)